MDDGLIDEIYETGAMPERWPVLLEKIQEIAGAEAGILQMLAQPHQRS